MSQTKKRSTTSIVVWVMGVIICGMGIYGFGTKFIDFIRTSMAEEGGEFAIIPILNYSFATTGFILLFGWAMFHGMFKNVEKPKYDHLERERELDRLAGIDWNDS
jgi:hypothetical protein